MEWTCASTLRFHRRRDARIHHVTAGSSVARTVPIVVASQPSSPAKAVIRYSRALVMESRSCGIPDTPLKPVIGLADGETRWRGTTAMFGAAQCVLLGLPAAGMSDELTPPA